MAATLHDILEDTPATEDDLRAAGMPEDVIAAVVALTHRPEDSYEAYVEQLAGNALAREVKLANRTESDWVVSKGLEPADRIVVEGIQKVRPGSKVRPMAQAAGLDSVSKR